MTIADTPRVLDAARELGDVIREHRDEAERERRLSQPVVDALARAGLFRLFTPESLGGLEVDPMTAALVIEEVAGFDSAAGWMLMVANSVDWWCARLPDAGAEELYADDPNVIIAAAFHPPMRAERVAGGYRVSGRSPLASNVHAATWLLVTAAVTNGPEGEGTGEVIGAICRAGEAEIIDTWHSLGMRGTDSNDVALHGVMVPAARTFALVPGFSPGSHYQGPLYRYPAMGEVAVVSAPTALAVAREAISEFRQLAQGKTPFGSARVLRERSAAQARLARAEAIVRSARLLLYDTLEAAWARTLAGEPASLEQKADLTLAAAHAVSSAVQAGELVYGAAGSSGVYARNPLERHFRDLQTLRHHGFVSESRFETAGQVYLGVEPEFGLVAF